MPQKQRQVRMQEQPPPPAGVVAKRLCDLLLSFPAAAAAGVQWRVLVAKYEEQYSSRLDVSALGHSSPLGAASMLLWDVLRIVDKEDTDNPVVGIEDGLALTPQPGVIGCWPSLYQVLCDMILEDGASVEEKVAQAANLPIGTHFLLLSRLRPLIERKWHDGFDETSLSYRNEDGAVVRFKKMKHMLQALLRWREQRQEWLQECGGKPSAVDDALRQKLELVPSKKHNDLMLCCRTSSPARTSSRSSVMTILLPEQDTKMQVEEEEESDLSSTRPSSSSFQWRDESQEEASEASSSSGNTTDAELRSELLRLRVENQKLRVANSQLQRGKGGADSFATPSKRKSRIGRGSAEQKVEPRTGQKPDQKADQRIDQRTEQKTDPQPEPTTQQRPAPRLPTDLFDDPFEPPPEISPWVGPQQSPMSCSTPSEVSSLEFGVDFRSSGFVSANTSGCTSGAMTPVPHMAGPLGPQWASSSSSASGPMTPIAHAAPQQQQPSMQAMMPVWFPFMEMQQSLKGMMDVAVIPRGIVDGARQRFENIVG